MTMKGIKMNKIVEFEDFGEFTMTITNQEDEIGEFYNVTIFSKKLDDIVYSYNPKYLHQARTSGINTVVELKRAYNKGKYIVVVSLFGDSKFFNLFDTIKESKLFIRNRRDVLISAGYQKNIVTQEKNVTSNLVDGNIVDVYNFTRKVGTDFGKVSLVKL